jgi:hypothetical protein
MTNTRTPRFEREREREKACNDTNFKTGNHQLLESPLQKTILTSLDCMKIDTIPN